MKKETFRRSMCIIICLILAFLILFISYMIYSETKSSGGVCIASDNPQFNCGSVQSSAYAFVFGIPVSYIGLGAIILLTIIFIFSEINFSYKIHAKKLFFIGSIIGIISSIYFISIQLFVLKEICSMCMIVDSTIILLGIISVIFRKYNKSIY
jgi:uncharacterized membrane protein